MAGRINDEDIALVRERCRIDDVVRDYVALRSAGGGSWKGLCPFHDEKTPSFTVTPSRGFFYCFGCGEGGDVITFLQRQQNLSFTEAVQTLADRAGIIRGSPTTVRDPASRRDSVNASSRRTPPPRSSSPPNWPPRRP